MSYEPDLRCPNCDAPIKPGTPEKCWLCREPLAFPVEARHGNRNAARTDEWSARVILGIVVVLLSVGITLVAPGLLFFFLIVASPFVIYALVGGPRKQAAAAPIRPRTRVEGVLGWIGAAIVVGATAFMAFVAAFVAVCTGGLALGVVTQYQNENLCTFIGIASLVAGFFAAVMAATSVTRRYRS